MTVAEKISKVLAVSGLNASQANSKIGLGNGTLQKIIDRKGGWHESTQEKFLRHFNVNPEWWTKGKGEILLEKLTSVTKVDEAKSDQLIETLQASLSLAHDVIAQLKQELADCRKGIPSEMQKKQFRVGDQ